MPTMLTYHCKLCDKRFYRKLAGKRKGVYCSFSCHAKARIAGKDHHMRWISVKDGVPEVDVDVLVYSRDRKSVFMTHRLDEYYENSEDYENKFAWNDQGIFNSITHWMPLPKPPKEFRRKSPLAKKNQDEPC